MAGPETLCYRAFIMPALMMVVLGAFVIPAHRASAADAAAGKSVFRQCLPCHKVGEKARNGVGPVLNGLFGRKAGTLKGYNFSKANKSSGIVWDEASFRTYIKKPRAVMPGTKMIFPGLRRDKNIDNLIAYLNQFDSDGKIKPPDKQK